MKGRVITAAGLLVLIAALVSCGETSSSSGGSSSDSGEKKSEDEDIHLVASESFCIPTGISDVYRVKAHEHEIVECGVKPDRGDEIRVKVIQ
jgi:hypothetical protein